jgi:hypothetical protein
MISSVEPCMMAQALNALNADWFLTIEPDKLHKPRHHKWHACNHTQCVRHDLSNYKQALLSRASRLVQVQWNQPQQSEMLSASRAALFLLFTCQQQQQPLMGSGGHGPLLHSKSHDEAATEGHPAQVHQLGMRVLISQVPDAHLVAGCKGCLQTCRACRWWPADAMSVLSCMTCSTTRLPQDFVMKKAAVCRQKLLHVIS